ncbi:hypothetical protein R4O66_002732 [Salmonella enterica]|nr:hypothetical protein [Salmonella enterica]EKK6344840.1 hypothetical protein [Salmonella enterica]ELO7822879.1 hypothetical protein [Salmonella enterica]ELR6876909.1 hypothetical protein [Salmonella enterica]
MLSQCAYCRLICGVSADAAQRNPGSRTAFSRQRLSTGKGIGHQSPAKRQTSTANRAALDMGVFVRSGVQASVAAEPGYLLPTRYDRPQDHCSETMETLLRNVVGAINDIRHHQPPEITVFRVDRTRLAQADAQYSRLRECALSLTPAATALSERISP